MICPNCGRDLPDNSQICLHCGRTIAPVSTVSDALTMESPSLSRRKNRDSDTEKAQKSQRKGWMGHKKKEAEKIQNPKSTPSENASANTSLVPDEHPEAEEGSETINLASALSDPLADTPNPKASEKRTALRTFLLCFLVFAFIAGAGIGAHFWVTKQYVTWERFYNILTNKEVAPPAVPPAEIDVFELNGKYYHRFTVTGADDYTLIAESLESGQRIQFQDGEAVYEKEDSTWITEVPNPSMEFLEVHMDLWVMDRLGYTSKVEIDPFLIDVPQVPVDFAYPTMDLTRVYNEDITLIFTPPSGSTITINGENVMHQVDENGTIHYPMKAAMGDNKVRFEATMPHARPLKKEFLIKRTLEDVNISLETLPPSRIFTDTYTISGMVVEGAELSSDFPSLNGIQHDKTVDSGGQTRFSFTAKLEEYKRYEITIVAKKEGFEDTPLTVTIERAPDAQTYANNAKAADPSLFYAQPETFSEQSIHLTGSVLTTETDHVYQMDLGLGEGEKVEFTYYGPTQLLTGETVRIYGEYTGQSKTEGIPQLMIWFVTRY